MFSCEYFKLYTYTEKEKYISDENLDLLLINIYAKKVTKYEHRFITKSLIIRSSKKKFSYTSLNVFVLNPLTYGEGALYATPILCFCPLLKITFRKILDLSKLFVADAPTKK